MCVCVCVVYVWCVRMRVCVYTVHPGICVDEKQVVALTKASRAHRTKHVGALTKLLLPTAYTHTRLNF